MTYSEVCINLVDKLQYRIPIIPTAATAIANQSAYVSNIPGFMYPIIAPINYFGKK